jgi:hypothetical protein
MGLGSRFHLRHVLRIVDLCRAHEGIARWIGPVPSHTWRELQRAFGCSASL